MRVASSLARRQRRAGGAKRTRPDGRPAGPETAPRRCRLGGTLLRLLLFLESRVDGVGWGHISMDFFLRATSEPPARASDSPCSGAAQVVKSCPFAALGSPGGRIGSVLDVGKRLRRMYQCFHRWIQISTGPQQCADLSHDPPKFSIQSSLESTERSRMRSRRPSDLRPIPERVREPIYIRKK